MKMLFRISGAVGCLLISTTFAMGAPFTFTFDDGTFEGWDYITREGDPLVIGGGPGETPHGWAVTDEAVDSGGGEGFDVLQGSSVHGIGEVGNPQRIPNPRVLPSPFTARDSTALTQILRSPVFNLDDSSDISVDMIGGQAQGGRSFDPNSDTPPQSPTDLEPNKGSGGWQGFALYDVAEDQYVRWGFPTFNNDGKERDGRDVWETVTIPREDLVPLANDGKDYRVDIFDSYSGGWGWIGFDTVVIPNADFGAAPGDFNSDGTVDSSDYEILVANFRSGQTFSEGDFNFDGKVDLIDFTEFVGVFNQQGAVAAVPEPSTLLLLALSGCFVWAFRRRTVRAYN